MPPIRPWHVLLACLALVVPIQAGALEGRSGLAVSASLGQCGVSGTGIMCRIDVSWSGVDHATRYEAAVTLADGSVRDLGAVGGGSGGSTSVWVPYAGEGTYTVTVTAWGSDPEGRDKELEDDDAEAVIEETAGDESKPPAPEADEGPEGGTQEPDGTDTEDGPDAEGTPDAPPSDPPPPPEEPPAEAPSEEQPTPAPEPPSPSPAAEMPPKATPEAGAPEAAEQKAPIPE